MSSSLSCTLWNVRNTGIDWCEVSENIIQLKPSLDYLAFIQEVDQRNPDIDLIYRRPEGIKETALRDLGMFLMVEKIVYSAI